MLFNRFFDAIDYWADSTPTNPAMWFSGVETSYGDLRRQVDDFARSLVANGVLPGEVVAVLTTPRPEFLIALAAVHKAGAIYLGINPNYTQREQLHVVADSRPVALFSLASVDGRRYSSDVELLCNKVDSIRMCFRLDSGPSDGVLTSIDQFHERRTGAESFPDVDRMDPSTIVYTSGSSGAPKGAILPHYGVAYGAHCDAREMGVPQPRVLCNLPANHTGCIIDVQGSTIVAGGMVAFSERFDPAEMLRLVEGLRLTNLQHVPTVLQILAMHPDFSTRDLSSLRLVAWGGAPLAHEYVKVYSQLEVRLFTIYGLTESCGNATFSHPTDGAELLASTVGKPNPDADVRIVDDDGNDVPDGVDGEIWYRHEAQFIGYWGNDEATRRTLTPDGFLRTGDIGVRLPTGHIRLVGRRSEMFKSGGLNVYPREVELVIEEHPSVAMAAVVGVADETYGESGIAFIVCEPGLQIEPTEVKQWCKERLAGYKVPKVFQIRTELPLLPIGKVDKQRLKRDHAL